MEEEEGVSDWRELRAHHEDRPPLHWLLLVHWLPRAWGICKDVSDRLAGCWGTGWAVLSLMAGCWWGAGWAVMAGWWGMSLLAAARRSDGHLHTNQGHERRQRVWVSSACCPTQGGGDCPVAWSAMAARGGAHTRMQRRPTLTDCNVI